MEIARVEVSTNVLHVDLNVADGVGGIYKDLIDALLSANPRQFLDGDQHARHGRDVIDHGQSHPPPIGLPLRERAPELADDLGVGPDGEWEADLNDVAAGAGHVSLDGLLDSAVGVVEHDDGVAGAEPALPEGPGDLLEDDGGGGGGVVDDGDLVDVIGVDQVLDEGSGFEDGGFEVVEVEVVGLAEVEVLVEGLDGQDRRRAAAEAAVVDAGD